MTTTKKINRAGLDTLLRTKGLNLNTNARAVLLAYASHMQFSEDAQEAWPSATSVADYTGMNRDTVAKYTDALVKDGFLIAGEQHRYDKFNYSQGYFLGEGEVSQKVLQRRSGANTKNLKKSDADSVGTGSDADTTSKRCRHDKEAMPTRPGSDADSVGRNNKGNNKGKNNREEQDRATAGAASQAPSNEGVKGKASISKNRSNTPNLETPSSNSPQGLETPSNSPKGAADGGKGKKEPDYETLAKRLGFHSSYQSYLNNLGYPPKKAFKYAKAYAERRMVNA